MKVTGETFSYLEKEPKRQDIKGIAITYEGVNEYERTHKHK